MTSHVPSTSAVLSEIRGQLDTHANCDPSVPKSQEEVLNEDTCRFSKE